MDYLSNFEYVLTGIFILNNMQIQICKTNKNQLKVFSLLNLNIENNNCKISQHYTLFFYLY